MSVVIKGLTIEGLTAAGYRILGPGEEDTRGLGTGLLRAANSELNPKRRSRLALLHVRAREIEAEFAALKEGRDDGQ